MQRNAGHQDFEIYDKQALLQFLDRLRENSKRHRLRAIVSIHALRNQELREQMEAELPGIDILIVDEAHHASYPSTQTSETLRELGAMGDCELLSTATALHLGSTDLFTLLSALRPTEFRDSEVFGTAPPSQRHRGGATRPNELGEACTCLQKVFTSEMIRVVLRQMQAEGKVEKTGEGRGSRWRPIR